MGGHVVKVGCGPLVIDLNTFEFANIKYLLYGLTLVLMMLYRPEGLFPSRQRRRELHFAEELARDEGDGEPLDGVSAGGLGEVPGADEVFGEDTTDAGQMGQGR